VNLGLATGLGGGFLFVGALAIVARGGGRFRRRT
jgi:hypothetical protein